MSEDLDKATGEGRYPHRELSLLSAFRCGEHQVLLIVGGNWAEMSNSGSVSNTVFLGAILEYHMK